MTLIPYIPGRSAGHPILRGKAFPKLSRVRRASLLLCLASMLSLLPGCQSITGNTPAALVRVIDATPDAHTVDVYQGNGIVAYNLGLGTVTSYVSVAPGTYSTVINFAGTRQQIVSANSTFSGGGQYTVILGNYSVNLQEMILKDQTEPARQGQIALRFVAQATRATAVDVYLIPSGSTIAAVHPFLTNVSFGTNTGYLNVPAGTYTLAVLPSGATPRVAGATLYTSSAIAYPSGSAKTFVLIDQPPLPMAGLQVIAASDYDPSSPNN